MSTYADIFQPFPVLSSHQSLPYWSNDHVHLGSWIRPRIAATSAASIHREPRPSRRSRPVSGRRMPMRISTDSPSSHMPALPPTVEEDQENGTNGSEATIGPTTRSSPEETRAPPSTKPIYPPSHFSSLHFHRDSGSTSASDSTASSPVTAPSLTDSYNLGDTPVGSPDTPASSLPPYSPAFTLATSPAAGPKSDLLRQLPAPKELPRPSTGPKKPRNLKNLAVDTSGTVPLGRAVSTASLPLKHSGDSAMISLAPTPSSLGHPQPSRRKSSQLGLKLVTPPSQSPIRQQGSSFPPPTPSLIRPNALRHFPSSPLLPLKSPGGPPEGGMQLPPLAKPPAAAVGFAEAPAEQEEDESTRFDIPQSRELKVAAYPDGPICIYDPHVYLYLEPTEAEASKFGVVLNVASEVLNPFKKKTDAKVADFNKNTQNVIRSSTESSPTTPKAVETPANLPLNEPEYIHIPWEHNTDIVPELFGLSKLVDERVQDGKSVLIHCQCGVSRSASLIVAYGLYKNPSLTVQEAYDAVKRRSKWIGPNMSLIMQLQEFRTELLKSSAHMPAKARYNTEPARNGADEITTRSVADRDRSKLADDRPKSAPLPPEKPKTFVAPSSVDDSKLVGLGPSSAKLDFTWPTNKCAAVDSEPPSAYATPQESPSIAHTFTASPTQSMTSLVKSDTPVRQVQVEPLQAQSIDPKVLGQHNPVNASPFVPQDVTSSTDPVAALPEVAALNERPGVKRDMGAVTTADVRASTATDRIPPQSQTTISQSSHVSENLTPIIASLPSRSTMTSNASSSHTYAQGALQSIHNIPRLSARRSQPLPRLTTKDTSPAQFVLSPRADEFAMTSVVQPPSGDSFGLSSPRATTFTAQLPHHGEPPGEVRAATSKDMQTLRANLATSRARPQPSPAGNEASERATMRSRLGMSTSSSYDMRSEYVLAAKARELRPPALPNIDSHYQSDATAVKNDFSEALLSPRATELTANPFDSAMGAHNPTAGNSESNTVADGKTELDTGAEGASASPRKTEDPRSPPQRGISPIVRSIFEAFS